jgi:DNA-directed RNA polymerase specialized sigma24 family protein
MDAERARQTQAALAMAIVRYRVRIHYAGLEPEDVFQDVYVWFLENERKYQPSRGMTWFSWVRMAAPGRILTRIRDATRKCRNFPKDRKASAMEVKHAADPRYPLQKHNLR